MELLLFVAGCLTFPCLHYVSMRCLSFFLPGKSKYLYLTISTRIVSLFQAVCATCIGLQVILTCKDIMKDRYLSIYNYAWFGVSYFYYDLVAMFLETYHRYSTEKLWKIFQELLSRKWLLVCHHIFLPLFGFPIIVFLRHGIGDFFVGCIYLAEISTPFLSAEAILKQLDMKHSILYEVNGILLGITYFVGRILIFPFMYWSYSLHSKQLIWLVPFRIPLFCNLCCLALLLLQMVWFITIVKQLTQFFTTKKLSKSSQTGHFVNGKQDRKVKIISNEASSRILNGKQK